MSAAPELDASTAAPRLLELLLEEEQQLSAVERFAQRHEEAVLPLQARYYSDLIPTGRVPRPGEQYAFQVDLDACTGCKACVTACHSLNGLDSEETWRDVGLVRGGSAEAPFQQTVTTACHHCVDPACLAGCPVKAYEKDPVSGIVRHLDDQCIGCQYCVLKCPYDVPKYNAAMGIVRKCDMCAGRLAEGEAPACVQGCPNGAISIQIVPVEADPVGLLPVAGGALPDSAITRPTTRYRTAREWPEAAEPADLHEARPADPHTPLAVMLVLVQLSVGATLGALGLWAAGLSSPSLLASQALLAAGMGAAGQAGALLHLGRPQYAFRAVLGWRSSWMSREILLQGAYLGAAASFAALAAALAWLPLGAWTQPADALLPLAGAAAAGLGLLGAAAGAMIYVDTRRPFWAALPTGLRFAGSALVLGLGASLVCASALAPAVVSPLAGLLAAAALLKLGGLAWWRRSLAGSPLPALRRSAALLRGALRGRLRTQGALALAGGVALPLLVPLLGGSPVLAGGALGLALAGELMERHLFFTAVASPAMPGE